MHSGTIKTPWQTLLRRSNVHLHSKREIFLASLGATNLVTQKIMSNISEHMALDCPVILTFDADARIATSTQPTALRLLSALQETMSALSERRMFRFVGHVES